LNVLGGPRTFSKSAHPPMPLSALDKRVYFLQANTTEKSTSGGYTTGAWDYIKFCLSHSIAPDPTPNTLAQYIAFTSKSITSGPKYLTGVCHFLKDLYPDFDTHCSHPLVTVTICSSKKIWGDPVKWKLPLRLCHLETFLKVAQNSRSYNDLLFITILSFLCLSSEWRVDPEE